MMEVKNRKSRWGVAALIFALIVMLAGGVAEPLSKITKDRQQERINKFEEEWLETREGKKWKDSLSRMGLPEDEEARSEKIVQLFYEVPAIKEFYNNETEEAWQWLKQGVLYLLLAVLLAIFCAIVSDVRKERPRWPAAVGFLLVVLTPIFTFTLFRWIWYVAGMRSDLFDRLSQIFS